MKRCSLNLIVNALTGSVWSCAANRKLTDRAFDVDFDPRHLREEIDIGNPYRASAETHVSRHQVERLDQHADILEDQRIGD